MLAFDRLHAKSLGPTERAAQIRLVGSPVNVAIADAEQTRVPESSGSHHLLPRDGNPKTISTAQKP
jgi:hypothetical protein